MADRIQFFLIGGFLGAGKTTLIGALARRFVSEGKRVGIITNDQAADLVDTHNLRGSGFAVEEVPGSCFCCAFDELAEKMDKLRSEQRPQVLIGEPVGSCTDLVATVLRPLQQLYPDAWWTTPLAVLVDPARVTKILTRAPKGGFSPKAAYIYEKQLQEADVIVLNKIDGLTEQERVETDNLIRSRYPDTPLLGISGRSELFLDELLEHLLNADTAGRHTPDVDYDIYAEGEAELGWLNATATVSAEVDMSLDQVVMELLGELKQPLGQSGEIAHLKIVAATPAGSSIGNLVRSDGNPELSVTSGAGAKIFKLIVNARVFLAPEILEPIVRTALDRFSEKHRCAVTVSDSQAFRPGRPVPTHRFRD